jgi:hypothetical protein
MLYVTAAPAAALTAATPRRVPTTALVLRPFEVELCLGDGSMVDVVTLLRMTV